MHLGLPLTCPPSDPMASLPWLILAWHEVRGGEGAGEGKPGYQGKGGHLNWALI